MDESEISSVYEDEVEVHGDGVGQLSPKREASGQLSCGSW